MKKFKTLKGLCKYLAQANQQDKAHDIDHRWIFHATDFTEQDKKEIEHTAKILEYTINNDKFITKTYNDFNQLLKKLKQSAKHLFFSFLIQEQLLQFLPLCEINN